MQVTGRKFMCPVCKHELHTIQEVGGRVSCNVCMQKITVPENAEETKMEHNLDNPNRSSAVTKLQIFAWLDLLVSIVFGIYYLISKHSSHYDGLTESELLIGVAIICQGIFIGCLLIVIAEMAQDLRAIRTAIMKNAGQ